MINEKYRNQWILHENEERISNFRYPGSEGDSDIPDDLDLTLLMFLGLLEEAVKNIGRMFEMFDDLDELKKKVCYILTNENSELLKDAPTRKILGMNIVYFIVLDIDNDTFKAIPITNNLIIELGMSENELYECAKENTPKMLPLKTIQNESLRHTINSKLDIEREIINGLSVYTNKTLINGASSLLYDGTMEHFADEYLNGNIVVLPISCHRVLICTTQEDAKAIKSKLLKVLDEINKTNPNELLSNEILAYDREHQELDIL